MFHGSALWSISHKCALYITGKEEEIKKRYNWCLAADEVFLQTEVYHSPFRNSLYHFEGENGNLRLIDWTRREGSSPHTFTIKDIELIEKQANAMFARKFDEENMEIIDYLYQKLKV